MNPANDQLAEDFAALSPAPTGWPEDSMVVAEHRLGYHVRMAMRSYAIAMLYELRMELLTDAAIQPELREAFSRVLEAKAAQLREFNRIDHDQQPEPRPAG